MKKLLLVCLLAYSYYTNAQCDSTLPVLEDFSDKTAVEYCWDFIDADGDGHNWNVVDLGGGNNAIRSASHINGVWPFTPDNWIISEGINLTAVGSASLSWKVKARDWNADNENYTVYVSTGNQISNFLSSSVSYSEDLNGTEARWQSRSLDATSLAGQMVYVAVRHHNTYDQSAIDFDDLSMTSTGGSGCITDSDNDGVCDSVDQCPGFDDRIDTNGNGIPDGCDNTTCNEKSADFANNTLTHSGTGNNATTLTLPSESQNISFTISGLDEKTKGKQSSYYIERVTVTYKDGSGAPQPKGIYRGDQLSSATINFPDNIQSITVSLDDGYDGNSSTTMSVNLSPVTYCGTQAIPCSDSDGDGVCDTDDICPSTSAGATVDATGCEITGCQESSTNFTGDALSGSNTITLTLPDNSQDVSFTISGLSEKLRGKSSTQYIEIVEVLYDHGSGYQSYGTYSGSDQSSASINILGTVKHIKVTLTDQLGNTGSNLGINLSTVTYCISSGSKQAQSSKKEVSSQLNYKTSEPIETGFKIYPNPASSTLYVKSTGLNDSKSNITLYNINGAQVRSYHVDSNYSTAHELDINGLATGLYMLRIMSESGSLLKTERIVIK